MKRIVTASFIIFICIFYHVSIASYQIISAKIQGPRQVEVKISGKITEEDLATWTLDGGINIDRFCIIDDRVYFYSKHPIPLQEHFYLQIPDRAPVFLFPDGVLDSLYSEKPLGNFVAGNQMSFRVFAPRARWVRVVLFKNYDSLPGLELPMQKDQQGVWEYEIEWDDSWSYYGYRVWGPVGEGEMFDSTLVLADPYSQAVTTLNHYTHPGKSLIMTPRFYDWGNDNWTKIKYNDLIIYEMHIRDLTAHPSSGMPSLNLSGTYTGLIESRQRGGLPYIKSLGVNAVELLPVQDFGNMEVPYRDPSAPVFNTWNPYAFNHWGYMTSYFFAPETYYSTGGEVVPGQYSSMIPIDEFKNMVKAFHSNGITVLMDVVYNHVSQYDYNPLKYIDKFYYFRLNEDCSFTSVSGCGNDLKTERPMARRLIVDSVIHWMTEYHIDGFRFDLAKLIDWETIDRISQEAQKINPEVILIAEPWGGGYDPSGFSDHHWASWNDQIRNGIKGQNPHDGLGFIFGKWQGENSYQTLRRYFMGSLRQLGGQYVSTSHSVNYLESHDDHTLGDFIRIGLGHVTPDQKISDIYQHTALDETEMKINKLGALALFSAQGPVMIHSGQEFARSKVIAPTPAPDPEVGKIDHNSYNKNNETNWLNYDLANLNKKLTEYYQGLIRMRQAHRVFRDSQPEYFEFYPQPDSLFLVFQIRHPEGNYLVLLNGNRTTTGRFTLPAGGWGVLADAEKATDKPFRRIQKREVIIPSSTGMILLGSGSK